MNDEPLIRAALELGKRMRAARSSFRNPVDLVLFLEHDCPVFRSLLGAMVCCSMRQGVEFVELDELVWKLSELSRAKSEITTLLSSPSSSSSSSPAPAIVAEKLDEFLNAFDAATQKLRANRADGESKLELFTLIQSLYGVAPVRFVLSERQTRRLGYTLGTHLQFDPEYLLLYGNRWYSTAIDQLPKSLHHKLMYVGVRLFRNGMAVQLSTGAVFEHQGVMIQLPPNPPGVSEILEETLRDISLVLQDKLPPNMVQQLFDGLPAGHDEVHGRITEMRKLVRPGPSPEAVSDPLFYQDMTQVFFELGNWLEMDSVGGDPLGLANDNLSDLDTETMSNAGDVDHGAGLNAHEQAEYDVLYGETPFGLL